MYYLWLRNYHRREIQCLAPFLGALSSLLKVFSVMFLFHTYLPHIENDQVSMKKTPVTNKACIPKELRL